jgi:hypothetical protein
MNLRLNRLGLAVLAGFAFSVAACGDDDNGDNGNGPTDAGNGNGGTDAGNGGTDAGPTDPCDTQDCVDLTFTIDDSANDSWSAVGNLAWNDFGRSPDANIIDLTNDGSGVWSITVGEPIPMEDVTYNYGANAVWGAEDAAGSTGDWIWAYDSREVGAYSITATAADGDDIMVPGLVIPAFGDWDIRVMIDTNNLADGFDASGGVAVKTSRHGFYTLLLNDDGMKGDMAAGDGIFTYQQSEQTGANAVDSNGAMAAGGLLAPGDNMEIIPVIGGSEYKAGGSIRQGLSAEIRDTSAAGSDWLPMNFLRVRNDRNTAVKAHPTRQYDYRVTVDTSAVGDAWNEGDDVFFTNTWVVEQQNGDFIETPMFDDGSAGDMMADDGIFTFVLSEWVGGEWAREEVDFRQSLLLGPEEDPVGRGDVPASDASRFKVRFRSDGFYESLDGITVEYKPPGGEWTVIPSSEIDSDVGGFGNDFRVQIPQDI